MDEKKKAEKKYYLMGRVFSKNVLFFKFTRWEFKLKCEKIRSNLQQTLEKRKIFS